MHIWNGQFLKRWLECARGCKKTNSAAPKISGAEFGGGMTERNPLRNRHPCGKNAAQRPKLLTQISAKKRARGNDKHASYLAEITHLSLVPSLILSRTGQTLTYYQSTHNVVKTKRKLPAKRPNHPTGLSLFWPSFGSFTYYPSIYLSITWSWRRWARAGNPWGPRAPLRQRPPSCLSKDDEKRTLTINFWSMTTIM